MWRWLRGMAALVALGLAGPAAGTVTVTLIAGAPNVTIGGTVDVELRASISDPVVGYGLDLLFDDLLLETVGSPLIGAPWVALAAPDGDGLAGAAVPISVSGLDVLLATVTLRGLAPGTSAIGASFTLGDLTEGFFLDPSGIDLGVSFVGTSLEVVPEPGSLGLIACGLLAGAALRRTRAPRP